MRKGKRKKGEPRRHGGHSNSAQASSDSSPTQQASSESPPSSLGPGAPHARPDDVAPQPPGPGTALQRFDEELASQAASSALSRRPSCPPQPCADAASSVQTHVCSARKQPDSAPEDSPSNGCLERCGSGSKAAFAPRGAGTLSPVDSQLACSCATCPGSCVCWHRRGLCHSRIFDTLLPGDWRPLLERGAPSLLTFYRFWKNPGSLPSIAAYVLQALGTIAGLLGLLGIAYCISEYL
nr:unnamed protein product [Sorex araneus]